MATCVCVDHCLDIHHHVRLHSSMNDAERALPPSANSISIENSSSRSLHTSASTTIPFNVHQSIRAHARLVLLAFVSLLELLVNYVLWICHRVKTYPMKICLLLVICLGILIVHSFYLIQLAVRIEHRLQALNSMWPSSSSS
jgi:hypothetical protein